ncbi:MAG: Gfo/Idh/MocA family oxidoreductase [Candidatus Asgardarchaeia archaeon]
MIAGVIGIGKMGKNHVRVLSEFRDIDYVYVYDTDKAALKEVQEKYGARIASSLSSILKIVDLAVISTPTSTHFDIAKKAIYHRVNLLIEKPVTLTYQEGLELLKMAKSVDDAIIGIGHIERFNPIVPEIRKIVKEPSFIEIKRHNPASQRITDSTVVEDLMIHDIDLLFNVFFDNREYEDLFSVGNKDFCKALFKFENAAASLSASRLASKKIRSIYIETPEMTIEGNFMTQEVFIYYKPEKYGIENERYSQENIIEKVLVNKVEPLKVELKTFVDSVKENKQFPVTIEEGVNNLKICEEIKAKCA